ncbi:thiamine pyrophosphate-binding protein [Idiomarina sp. HP20-50]|uniref:thiamine pyrophosphate-binding protein n=1 Tax=Idiomarina sp. HP20-50 TaxID=3070813 RepID=UPI00294B3D41|nr:thiamine pyrophosphate-binding protein [Idiomarina sp. HP20-50]MDV6316343.1 thiamine pyrophosphate-binding protein [Idiomarina sp. HP20-50]
MKFTDVLLDQLEELGINELFGIPGDFILPLLADIQSRQRMPFHYLSHEPAITFCADAAARICNRPAAVFLTYGAGALNAVNSVAQAYEEHVPLIVIAGFPDQKEIDRGLSIHHQAKQVDSQRLIYEQVTCCQVRINTPATATEQLQKALSACRKYSRPVLIEVARSAFDFTVKPAKIMALPDMPDTELASLSTQLRKRLSKAEKPVILAGIDVRRFNASAALESFSSNTGIPIITTFLGRAVIDHTHPNFAGIFLDDADTQTYQLLQQSDLIIAAGVIRTDSNFAAHNPLFSSEKLVDIQQNHCHIEKSAYHHVRLDKLFRKLEQSSLPAYHYSDVAIANCSYDDTFNADNVMRTIHQQLTESEQVVPFVTDVGDCLFASLQAEPSLCLAPAYYASMGYAIPAAYGIQAATGMRPMVLVGDGAFLMTGLELGHFQRHGYAPIIVLFNNRCWDMIQAFSPQLECTNLNGWNYQQLSQSMNCDYYSVNQHQQLEDAIEQALAQTKKVSFIEIELGANTRTERLNRFAYRFLNA